MSGADTDRLRIAGHTDRVLTVEVDDATFDLHAMWLRDACTCSGCRQPSSNERLLDAAAVSPDTAIDTARIDAGELQVDTTDGHLVRIPTSRLAEHVQLTDTRECPARGRGLWDASTPDVVGRFVYDRLGEPPERRNWLEQMHRTGITIVGRCREAEPGVRDVAALIGPVRPTNYGGVWTVDGNIDPVTAVDSERALRVHTDLPYLDLPPGVQLMMVDNDGVEGGDSTFVDGFAVAEHLRTTDHGAWRLLTTIDFSYPFVRHDVEMHGRAPLIGLRGSGAYAVVRRAPDLVGSPFVAAAETSALYRAVRGWNDLLDGGEFEQRVTLRAGDVVVWDNHRVLHGRTAFRLGASGRRILHGCYVDMDHLRNEYALAARAVR